MRQATENDLEDVKKLLEDAQLSTVGVGKSIDNFVMIENDDKQFVGTVGMEVNGQIGLLRSFVIQPPINETDLLMLFQQVFQLALKKKLSTIYLATNKQTLQHLLETVGFTNISVQEALDDLQTFSYGKELLAAKNVHFMRISLSDRSSARASIIEC